MSHAEQYSKLETKELQSILDNTVDVGLKLFIISEIGKRKESSAITKAIEISDKLHLPYTDEDQSPLPNLFLRSNLFSASKTHGKIDKAIRDFKITCYQPEKEQLLVTAYRQFNQLDLDLLCVLLSIQQEQNAHLIKITAYELVKTLKGKGEGANQYHAIQEQLALLQNASLTLKFNQYKFIGSIINNAFFDDDIHQYIIELNPKLQPLFSNHNWTALNLQIRNNLKSNLAKWLHGFYSSHINSNLPIKAETIYKLSGATDKDIWQWNSRTLPKALGELKISYETNKLKFEYILDKGLLKVKKSQSNSQNRSIKSKIIKTQKMYCGPNI